MMASQSTFSIGELAGQTGVSVDALRYYERLGLLPKVPRTGGGFRVYTIDALDRVRFIKQAQRNGFTLAEVRELMRFDRGGVTECCRHIRQLLQRKLEDVDARLREMRAFKRSLDGYVKRCDDALGGKSDPACPVVNDLQRPPR